MRAAAQFPSIDCRLLNESDAEAVQSLRMQAVREAPRAFLESPADIAAMADAAFSRYVERGWLAGSFRQGKLLGLAGLYRHKGEKVQHKGTLWGVYVAPELRGMGIGRRLIGQVMSPARQAGIEQVHLGTDAQNAPAIALYESLGFERYGVERHMMKVEGGYVDDALMVKFLI